MMKIRPFRTVDRNVLLEFLREAEADHEDTFFDTILMPGLLKKKTKFVLQEYFLIAYDNDVPVGFSCFLPELPIRRVILKVFVRSGFRRRGFGSKLLNTAMDNSAGRGADKAHVLLSSPLMESRTFLENRGFKPVRRFFDLEYDLRIFNPERGEAEFGTLSSGDESLLAELQNRIFWGSWGFSKNTAEDIRFYLNLTGCRLEDILTLNENKKPIGYLWMHFLPPHSARPTKARIHMFGIDLQERGKKRGKQLLSEGLRRIKETGIPLVELTVDRENDSALRLYSSMGFQKHKERVWYEKDFSS